MRLDSLANGCVIVVRRKSDSTPSKDAEAHTKKQRSYVRTIHRDFTQLEKGCAKNLQNFDRSPRAHWKKQPAELSTVVRRWTLFMCIVTYLPLEHLVCSGSSWVPSPNCSSVSSFLDCGATEARDLNIRLRCCSPSQNTKRADSITVTNVKELVALACIRRLFCNWMLLISTPWHFPLHSYIVLFHGVLLL